MRIEADQIGAEAVYSSLQLGDLGWRPLAGAPLVEMANKLIEVRAETGELDPSFAVQLGHDTRRRIKCGAAEILAAGDSTSRCIDVIPLCISQTTGHSMTALIRGADPLAAASS